LLLLFGLGGGRVGGLLKSGQCVVPDALEVRREGGNPVRVQPVDTASAVWGGDD